MSHVVAASPISKIFLPDWSRKCAENPALIEDIDVAFKIIIPTSTGALGPFHYGIPVDLRELPTLKKFGDDKRHENIMEWLANSSSEHAANHETDVYGIVQADLGIDIQAFLSEKFAIETRIKKTTDQAKIADLKAQIVKIETTLAQATEGTQDKARELADTKVMRVVRNAWARIQREWQMLDESKQQRLAPSHTEICIMHVLRKEIGAQKESRSKIMESMQGLMEEQRSF